MVQSIGSLKNSGRPEVQDVGPRKFGSQALEKALQDKIPSILSQLFFVNFRQLLLLLLLSVLWSRSQWSQNYFGPGAATGAKIKF